MKHVLWNVLEATSMSPRYLCTSGKQVRSYRAESVLDSISLRAKMHFMAGNLGWSLLTFIVRTYASTQLSPTQLRDKLNAR